MKKPKTVQGSGFRVQGKKAHSPQPRTPNQTADLLVEIGTEELPAAYLEGAIEQLKEEARRLFREAHLGFATADAFGTPRRLILVVRRLNSVQRNPPEEIRGPSKQASFDALGKPTGALAGFLRARGGTLSQTKILATEKGEYVYLLKPPRQSPTVKALPQLIEQLIVQLRFPKTMRWDESALRFARPIRWLLVLYGRTPIRASVGNLVSNRTTWVGGPKRPQAVRVPEAAQYLRLLKRHGVVWDQHERRCAIERFVNRFAKQHRGTPAPEIVTHGLLDEVTFLVEQPVALPGQFDPKYLRLPREVLLASQAKYQRVFAMQANTGKLLPKFIAILDGKPRKPNDVRRLYEHILNARLADSLLFWEQDRKRSLTAMAAQVSGVTFHEMLGSMAEKQARLKQLAPLLASMWSLSSEDTQRLMQACELAKADLASLMVKEFPTLQGVMGKYYAATQGEPVDVANAIEEHYLPLADKAPTTLIGQALSVLDKYDTLSAYFSIGIEPTGDQDPFGLRRAAQGIVEVAWSVHRPLPLSKLFRNNWRIDSIAGFRNLPKDALRNAEERLQRYLFERLYSFTWPKPVPSRDLIDAVRNSPWDDLVDAMDRIASLKELDGKPNLFRAAKVVERTHNILKPAAARQAQVDTNLLKDPLERTLWDIHEHNKDKFLGLIKQKSYRQATELYGKVFFDALHEFFERVLVNVQEESLKQNRLALMRTINTLYTEHVADLSKLAIPRQEVRNQ